MTLFPKPFKPIVTKYERKLCHALKQESIPFTPQKKIRTKSGRTYTVDIFIPPTLIIEVGYINPTDIQEHEDLKQTGYTVIAVPNKEIQNNLHKIVQLIKLQRQHKQQSRM